MMPDMLSGIVTPETIAIDLSENSIDLPKLEKSAGGNIIHKKLNKRRSSNTGLRVMLTNKDIKIL